MELKKFIKTALNEIIDGVEETRTKSCRNLRLTERKDHRTVEFDIAVSVESKDETKGKAEIQVLAFAAAGGDIARETSNSTVSRIQFGVTIDHLTKEEERKAEEKERKAIEDFKNSPERFAAI